ncbi:helix-turn-helix domain-containing protein, partial [Microcoleus sp. herbarium13]|uniref:helix-turn-helix domain-containing protein n=1 Tax=unclassified Microcoleus TaxID=2642155 RepID=UPI003FA5DB10
EKLMTYEQVQSLKPEAFKRFCGVGSTTFDEMVSVLEEQKRKKRKPGRPPKLSLEDQVLLALQYWREYRTYFHIAQSWNINRPLAKVLFINLLDGLSGPSHKKK